MLDSLDARLKNWGRHFRNHFHKAHCYSLEGRYRSPQEWGDWETGQPMPAPLPPVDVLDACFIEDAWRMMDNRKLKKLLALHYVQRKSRGRIKRGIGLVDQFDDALLMAQASILRFIAQMSENCDTSQYRQGYFGMVVQAPVSVYA